MSASQFINLDCPYIQQVGAEGDSKGLRGFFSFLTLKVSPEAAAPP